MAVDNVGMDVPVNMMNRGQTAFENIRGAGFVSKERTGPSLIDDSIKQKRIRVLL